MELRISWDEYFLRVAQEIAQRSSCPRASVGAIVVHEKQILGHGYNGSPRGLKHCCDVGVGCLIVNNHCIRVVHAEVNAILSCHNIPRDSSIYVTHLPCLECCKIILQTNISRVIYDKIYRDSREEAYGITQQEMLTSTGAISLFQNVISEHR